jgi:two-component system chemotaxis response regulator CheY
MKKRVMTVDDSASVRMMVRYSLQGAGYEAIEATDGVDALEKLLETEIHALIVDVNMPRMDGIEFVRKLREIPEHQNTPVLMLTTEEDSNRVEAGKSAGASGWMVKPFSPEELINILKSVMS